MNLVWLATAMMPKKNRNEFDREENGVIKSKKAWKNDAYINFGIFVGCLLFIIFFNFGLIPFFIAIYGVIRGIIFCFRATVIYKSYDSIFSEEITQKIES